MLKAIQSLTRAPVAARMSELQAGQASARPADRDLYYRIGLMLFDHALPPTPRNYALAHAYVSGDPQIVAAVDARIAGEVRLSQAAADEIMGAVPEPGDAATVSPADLAAMIGEAQARFDQFAGIVDMSRADAASFGAALEEGAAGLAAGDTLDVRAVAALIEITHSMISSTRNAEQRLRTTAQETAELRASLASARQDAETDPMTGLPNRRAFAARCGEARARALEGDRPLTIALIDIDRFKDVNDVHGHEVGDRVIQLIARELVRGCAGHLVARHGGEEFVILFEGLTGDAARDLLDATRESLAARSLRVAGTGRELGALTFSGGVATLDRDEGCAAALRRADELLYRAKQTGRNRIAA